MIVTIQELKMSPAAEQMLEQELAYLDNKFE